MVVLSCRIDDKVRLEVPEDRQHYMLYDIEVAFIRRPWRQGDVDSAPQCGRSAAFPDKAGPGIEGAAVLMQGNEQRIRIVPENVLGSVGMMDVRIHYGYAQGTSFRMKIAGSYPVQHDGFIVDIAKAPVAVRNTHGMMAWRAHQGKGLVFLFFKDEPCRSDGTACGSQI